MSCNDFVTLYIYNYINSLYLMEVPVNTINNLHTYIYIYCIYIIHDDITLIYIYMVI